LPIGLRSGSGIVGERGPRRFGVRMCVGSSEGEVAREVAADIVGDSG
jgi:hypothetical protein